ncbi:argininosuccinate synthase [Helicobacter canis]|uniref:argininosuccinate synthase n=1 Tax=Helicobacter canis TaxID=29419 RepID=UPI0026F0693D|nr:argininosuccinate synthase [Helicobacter canis]
MAVKKVVLAYSGGLDTSVILKWLGDTYGCEVVTFTADIGQGEEVEPARAKALKLGIKAKNIFIEDLQEEFIRDFVFPMFRANAIYEGEYLLGTSIARPLIAKRLVEIAQKVGADAIAHGATGKGNDQVRFELGAYALDPEIKVIAPWREWDLNSREKLLAYAKKAGIPIENAKKKSPYSMDANLLHISYEGQNLEDPSQAPEESMWRWSVSPKNAPDKPEVITIEFEKGDGIAINGKRLSPAKFWQKLNALGSKHGIGRLDLVENRFVGMKSRGCYETPGGAIYLKAHRAIESITLDREEAHLKDELMPRYASLIYNGFWFSKEREALQALIDTTQKSVNGLVRLELYKGSVMVLGRESSNSLFSAAYSTFEEDSVYDQKDAAGFIKLNALRFIIEGKAQGKKAKKSTKKLDKSSNGAKKSGKKESKKKQK